MRILLIVPSGSDSAYLKKALAEASHSTEVIAEARDASAMCDGDVFDLLILVTEVGGDLSTVLDDLQLLGKCAADAAVVVITGKLSPESRASLLRRGADACFERPFSFLELHERVRRLGVARNELPASRLRPRLDATTHTLVEEGRVCPLTRQEFLLVECLLRGVDTAVSRDLLIRYVWPGKDEVNPSNLTLLVSRVRAKFQGHAIRHRIQSVPGGGFMLRAAE